MESVDNTAVAKEPFLALVGALMKSHSLRHSVVYCITACCHHENDRGSRRIRLRVETLLRPAPETTRSVSWRKGVCQAIVPSDAGGLKTMLEKQTTGND